MTDRSAITDSPARAVERLIWQEADQVQPEEVAVEKLLADPEAAAKKVGLPAETVVAVLKSRVGTFAGWRARRERMAEERVVADSIGESVLLTRRRISRSTRGAISLPWLAAIAVVITGYVLTVIGHTQPYPLAPLAAVGPYVIGGGVGVGAAGSGVSSPYVILLLVFLVGTFLFVVGYYNAGGLQSWGL